MTETIEPLSALARLLVAYAPPDRRGVHRLAWAYDARLAAVVRGTTQPIIGQMRIAWWEEVLDDEGAAKGRGDPLVDSIRAAGMAPMPGLRMMLDGWEALLDETLDDTALERFAVGRGGGLFRALAGGEDGPDWLEVAGCLWALWDLAGHVAADDPVQGRALALARDYVPRLTSARWPRAWKPMRIATGLARHDVVAGTVPLAGLTPALYVRLLRIALLGR